MSLLAAIAVVSQYVVVNLVLLSPRCHYLQDIIIPKILTVSQLSCQETMNGSSHPRCCDGLAMNPDCPLLL